RVQILHAPEQLQRAAVVRFGPDAAVQAGHGLHVVVVDGRARLHHGAQGLPVALEVRREDLDAAGRAAVADRADAGRPDRRATVRQVVAIDGRDHRVVQAHEVDRAGQAQGLQQVHALGTAGGHGAEATGARADVAENDEGRLAGVEALADVRAVGLLADGVEAVLAD